MYWTTRHVLVCTASHCASRGANDVVAKLRLDIVRKGLDSQILINNCGTIDLCDMGPNIVVYPDNVILRGVSTKDIPEVVTYLAGGPIPERLVIGPGSEDELRRRAIFASALAAGDNIAPEAFSAIAVQNGFDDGWIAEQQRRGFIARKPNADGVEAIWVTKKARDRYRL